MNKIRKIKADISDMSSGKSMRLQYPKGTIVKDYFGHEGDIFDWNSKADEVAIHTKDYGDIWIHVNDIK